VSTRIQPQTEATTKAMTKEVFCQAWFAGAIAGLSMAASLSLPADATLRWNIYESSGNVIVSASGSLTLPLDAGTASCGAAGAIISSVSAICTGPNDPVTVYRISGPVAMNGSVNAVGANAVSGIAAGMNGGGSSGTGNPGNLFLSTSYTSGASIASTATFSGRTLASLGFTTTGLIGTWTLQPKDGTDPYNAFDTVYVCIGAAPCGATPAPAPLPLLGASAAFGWSRRLRRRVAQDQLSQPDD
jgi:hypothetical protein